MNDAAFNMEEFIRKDEEPVTDVASEIKPAEEETVEIDHAVELDVQKAVVESLAAEKVEMNEELSQIKERLERVSADLESKTRELAARDEAIASLKAELARKEAELSEKMVKELDLQERNPNMLALLDREVEIPDRFPGETRDHVLEVVKAAREVAEKEGRIRRAQVLEAVLMANEPNGTLERKRAELEKLFTDNNNLINGTVLEELKNLGISHKNGEEYLLPAEILKRTY